MNQSFVVAWESHWWGDGLIILLGMLQGKSKTSRFYNFHAETSCVSMKLLRVLTSHRGRVSSQTCLLLSQRTKWCLPFISPGLQAHYSGCAHRSENCCSTYQKTVHSFCEALSVVKPMILVLTIFFFVSSLLISWIHFKLLYSRSMSRWNMRYFSNIQHVCSSLQHDMKCPTFHFHS